MQTRRACGCRDGDMQARVTRMFEYCTYKGLDAYCVLSATMMTIMVESDRSPRMRMDPSIRSQLVIPRIGHV